MSLLRLERLWSTTLRGLSVCLLCWSTLAQAEDTKRYNPFERFLVPKMTSTGAANGSTSGAPKQYRFKHPRLKGVLQAQDGSIANLDGHILVQGESALGYTLVSVQDHSAKFHFRQQTITLHVTEDTP